MSESETIERRPVQATATLPGAVIGVLIGFQDEGRTPLVIFAGQVGNAGVAARTTLDVHGAHVGSEVVLLCEGADPRRPIIVGCLQRTALSAAVAGELELEVDGERTIVNAQEQLVLRCGKASITLTKAGKILLQGTYVSNRSSGVMRIAGGSVQLN
jgi:hypothetical protein